MMIIDEKVFNSFVFLMLILPIQANLRCTKVKDNYFESRNLMSTVKGKLHIDNVSSSNSKDNNLFF